MLHFCNFSLKSYLVGHAGQTMKTYLFINLTQKKYILLCTKKSSSVWEKVIVASLAEGLLFSVT